MRQVLVFIILGLTVGLSFNNCAKPTSLIPGFGAGFSQNTDISSTVNPYHVGEGSPREQQVLGIFQAHCANCHTPPLNNGGIKDIMDINGLIAYGWIYPGDPTNSKIFIEIQANRMPKGGAPLSLSDRETIRSWLLGDQGF